MQDEYKKQKMQLNFKKNKRNWEKKMKKGQKRRKNCVLKNWIKL